ncbi:MAG: HAD family hydrolase [Armatimonadetes bacterium]|nr:HAD family hydrolase [Armatimonadota bacterium]
MHDTSRPPHSFQAFLFDLDGTLIRTPIDFAGMKRSVLDLARRYGLDPDALNRYDILGIIEEAERQLEAAPLPPPFRAEAERELTRCEQEAASVAEELPGAIEALTVLRARGCAVGIVTRNCRAGVERALSRVPLPHDLLLTRNDVRRTKPDPEHLLEAARRFEAPPERCAMVGDHPMDMQAARAAGMFAIGVQTRDPSPDAFHSSPPDVLLPGIGDLLTWMSAPSS